MKRIHYLVISLVVLVLDVWTKWLVATHISLHETISANCICLVFWLDSMFSL